MTTIRLILLSIVLIALGITVGIQLDKARLPALLDSRPSGEKDSNSRPEEAVSVDPGETDGPNASSGKTYQVQPLSRDYIQRVLANLEAEQRQQLLADASLFHDFIKQEAFNRTILAAARANGMQDNRNVVLMMSRASDNVLREMYINQLMQEQLPAGFPSEDQVRQFYDDNRERFKTPERVQVWQVFLEVPEHVNQKAQTTVEKQARKLLQRLRDGRLNFTRAAIGYSDHEPSRRHDGYMGAVETQNLMPSIAEALQPIEQGDYALVRSDNGWHILKKGRTLLARLQHYEEVRQQARQLLMAQIHQEFRHAVIEEARKHYAFMPSDNRIEQWRLELKTGVVGGRDD